jgi:hypothetical protein
VTPDGRRTNARLRGMRVREGRLPSVNVPQALVRGLRDWDQQVQAEQMTTMGN